MIVEHRRTYEAEGGCREHHEQDRPQVYNFINKAFPRTKTTRWGSEDPTQPQTPFTGSQEVGRGRKSVGGGRVRKTTQFQRSNQALSTMYFVP
jgi:hypothetical protein